MNQRALAPILRYCSVRNFNIGIMNDLVFRGLLTGFFILTCQAYRFMNEKERLVNHLLTGYNKNVVPLADDQQPINVKHALSLQRIVSLEDKVLAVDTWVEIHWTNVYLSWNPVLFSDAQSVHLSSELMWTPDIELMNSAMRPEVVNSHPGTAILQHTGAVTLIPHVILRAFCNIDSHVKVGDYVTCRLKFLSWVHDGSVVDLHGPEVVDLSNFDNDFNDDWGLVNVTVTRHVKVYSCCPEPYVDIEYILLLERKT